ncbi:MAG: DNA-binding response regulator [Crocinitomicaceae bacterium]|nr:DNA-binding response regulator [Crocinitomicaceae bacterium]|tara:strand:- start:15124 stop:15774 length:651 start_codon:yes stop_codon:yes gene_type:complete
MSKLAEVNSFKKIEVVICDDHQIFKDGVKTTLKDVGWLNVSGDPSNGIECLELIQANIPDVVLLDINMPEMDGIECLKHIKEDYPLVKVIALTQYDEKRFVRQMLKYGADGYVLKSTNKKELLLAIQTVLDGQQYLAEYAKEVNDQRKDSPLFPHLSPREKDVLRLLADAKNTKEIAKELCISHHTVESHRSKIFRKIGVNNLASLVKWAVNNDYA